MPAKSDYQFTELGVRKLKPPPKPQQRDYYERLKKGISLLLRVSYGGQKTWRVVYYNEGKATSEKLGFYGDGGLSVQEARKAAERFNPDIAIASDDAGTFKRVAKDYISDYVEENGLRSKREIERHLEKYIYPPWGDKPLFSIRRVDVSKLLLKIKKDNGKSQALAVMATIRSVMNHYAAFDDRYSPPLARRMTDNIGLKKSTPRERVLDDDEIRAVWNGVEDMANFGVLVRLLLLTAQRREKVASIRWDDLDEGTWTVRTEEREKGNIGKVRLPKLARDQLKAVAEQDGTPFVFPAIHVARDGTRSPLKKPINSFSEQKAKLDAKLPKDMKPWTLHDLRRTARSLMARAGVQDSIADRVMGHKIPGVRGIYNRFSYLEEKSDALDRLASLVGMILNPRANNVVPLAR